MKKVLLLVCCILGALATYFCLDLFAPLLLKSRIGRLHEKDLPKATVEEGRTVYCRMKAADFRFPLPAGSYGLPPVITSGGFDWVTGSIEVRFKGSNQVTAVQYEDYVARRLQVGAELRVSSVPGGLFIRFHYFGDK